jgi:hypothetical protein
MIAWFRNSAHRDVPAATDLFHLERHTKISCELPRLLDLVVESGAILVPLEPLIGGVGRAGPPNFLQKETRVVLAVMAKREIANDLLTDGLGEA